MPPRYVLIDYENVQPQNLDLLARHDFNVIAFVGSNQAKIPVDVAVAMQALGNKANYVKMTGNGRNALDFHIAFYVGEITAREPQAELYIISNDSGFDPLIRHLRGRNFRIHRAKDLAEIPELRMSIPAGNDQRIAAIVKNLADRGQSRPRKVQTLTNTIKSLFAKKLSDAEIAALITALEERRYIIVNEGNVSYRLPEKDR